MSVFVYQDIIATYSNM